MTTHTIDSTKTGTVVTSVGHAGPQEITVQFADGSAVRCNRFWLRDNCPSNGDRESLFRPFTVASLTDDLAILSAEVIDGGVHVTLSDDVSELFSGPLLRGCSPSVPPEQVWTPLRSGDQPTRFTFDRALAGTARHHDLLDTLDRRGFAVVTGIPDEQGATEVMASWLGPIRETDFGRIFEIVSEPDPFTPSQSVVALDPHTDDPYRYSPTGVGILHCVSPCSGDGGGSTIVDGFAVAAAIAERDPAAYRLLSSVPIPYVHRREQSVEQGAAVHLRAAGPIISLDVDGAICGIRFHERSMAPLRLEPDLVDDVYRALTLFSRLVRSGEFAYEHRLGAGEAFVYDNQRVLHGRTAISGSRSRRHVRLCTVDRDQVHSRLRQLRETYAPGTEHGPLAAGTGA